MRVTPDGTCLGCGEDLSIGRRLLGKDRCRDCQEAHDARVRAEHEAAVNDYEWVVAQLLPGADLGVIVPRVRRAMELTPLEDADVRTLNDCAVARFTEKVLEDEVLTPVEDRSTATLTGALDATLPDELRRRYVISALNGGLLPTDPDPQIMLESGEACYWRAAVSLLTERVIKEYRTNYHSVSIPLGSGVRYRSGTGRGRQVVVGTQVETDDEGWLSVTSQRVVFSGSRRVLEFPLHRLVGVRLFGDGVALQVANRQSVPTFRTGAGVNEVVAAVISTIVALDRGTFQVPARPPLVSLPVPKLPPLLARNGYEDAAATEEARSETTRDDLPGPCYGEDPRADARAEKIFAELALQDSDSTESLREGWRRGLLSLQHLEEVPGNWRRYREWASTDAAQMEFLAGQLARFPSQRHGLGEMRARMSVGGVSVQELRSLVQRTRA